MLSDPQARYHRLSAWWSRGRAPDHQYRHDDHALPGALDGRRYGDMRVSGLSEDPDRVGTARRARPKEDVPCRDHGRLLRPGETLKESVAAACFWDAFRCVGNC